MNSLNIIVDDTSSAHFIANETGLAYGTPFQIFIYNSTLPINGSTDNFNCLAGGQRVNISGLTPGTQYTYQLQIVYSDSSVSALFTNYWVFDPSIAATSATAVATSRSNARITINGLTLGGSLYSGWLQFLIDGIAVSTYRVATNGNIAVNFPIPADGSYIFTARPIRQSNNAVLSTNSVLAGGGGIDGALTISPSTEYNNMAASLFFKKPDYAGAISQNVDITLVGETTTELEAAQTLVVHVPVADLQASLVYASNWNPALSLSADGEQRYPAVVFRPSALVANMAADTDSKTCETRFGEADVTTFNDDLATACLPAQKYLVDLTFPASADLYDLISPEDVAQVEAGIITVSQLSVVLASDVQSASTSESTATDYALNLFEQAAAAGKVTTAGVVDPAIATTAYAAPWPTGAGAKKVEFVVGDSITAYVTYTISKTRTYLLDAAVTGGTAKFSVTTGAGAVVDIPTGDTQTSDSDTKMIAWRFTAV